MYDRDDIYFVYPDDEGTRDTIAPLADQGQPYVAFTVYVFRDTITGLLYSADFAATTLTLTLISAVDEDTQNGPFDWLEVTNGWRIYVSNGMLRSGLFSTIYCPSAPGADQSLPTFAAAPPNVFVEPPGSIIYTPPDTPPEPVNPPPVIVLQIQEEWEWQFIDGTEQVSEEWEWSDPSIGTLQIDEEWES